MESKLLVLIIGVAVVGVLLLLSIPPGADKGGPGPTTTMDKDVKQFSSQQELNAFIRYNAEAGGYGYGGYYDGRVFAMEATTANAAGAPQAAKSEASEYSTTNIQVEGVDEADIVKNDGKYIYVISGNKVVIIDAYPAEGAEILSEIEFNDSPSEIFINGDRLIVFTQGYDRQRDYGSPDNYYHGPDSVTNVWVYDVSDREDPKLDERVRVDGNYFDSRMIGDYVYVVVNEPIYYRPCYGYDYVFNSECLKEDVAPPEVSVDGTSVDAGFPDIYYWDIPDDSYRFTTILAVNSQSGDTSRKIFVMGTSQEMFVSMSNIYVTRTSWMSDREIMEQVYDEVVIPKLPEDYRDRIDKIEDSDKTENEKRFEKILLVKEYMANLEGENRTEFEGDITSEVGNLRKKLEIQRESTAINKISISKDQIIPSASGKVPGNVLNQFSMDEYDGNFRIATTVGHVSRSGGGTSNNVYVLDGDLDVIGELEDLAPGEKIYSARFMGERCYLVTFKKVDPLFVIDLSDPGNPKVLGKLKIPGYSDYLHPYDENHLIGIGKGTVEAEEGDFAWYQGVKLSLFDVTDVSKPKEIDKYEIGDRGTDSTALHDHKAFLFSRSKNLLVVPILLAEIDEEKYPNGVADNQYGDYVWQGAYVFDVSLEGFSLKGRVSHVEDDEELLKSGYYYSSPYSVKRSLYMDDTLYTISDKVVKMNDLESMEGINSVELPYEEGDYYPYYLE